MAVGSVGSAAVMAATEKAAGKTGSSTQTRVAGGELGKNEFLQLLAIQLSNQDPLEPMKDTDFIAQMAQFSALEQMSELNSAFASSQAYSMVGKDVVAEVTINGVTQQVYGKVEGVVKKDGSNYLQVGDFLVPPSGVQAVYNDTAIEGVISQAAALVGKEVEARIPAPTEKDPSNVEVVSGKVTSILIKNGALYAKVGDKEVSVSYITKIAGADEAETPEAPEQSETAE